MVCLEMTSATRHLLSLSALQDNPNQGLWWLWEIFFITFLQAKYFYWWESSHKVLTVNKLLFPRLMCFSGVFGLTTPILNKTHNLLYNVGKDQRQHWIINPLITEPEFGTKTTGLQWFDMLEIYYVIPCTPSLSTILYFLIATFVWWSWLEWSGLEIV